MNQINEQYFHRMEGNTGKTFSGSMTSDIFMYFYLVHEKQLYIHQK